MSGGRPSRSIASTRNGRWAVAWWRLLLSAVLWVAVLWQGAVIETHAHPYPYASGGRAGVVSHQPSNDRHSPADPDNCPICQAVAIAGAYVPASPVAIPAPTPAATWYGTENIDHVLNRRQTHHWRSRAPPSDSQPLI